MTWLLALLLFAPPSMMRAQSTGSLKGRVVDLNGAVIPGAKVTLNRGRFALMTESNEGGLYVFKTIPAVPIL